MCLVYEPRTVEPDIVGALMPPTELAEGYTTEAVNENYVITIDSRILRTHTTVQPLQHVNGMLDGVSAGQRIAFEADLFDTHEPAPATPTRAMRSLDQVQRMKLDVAHVSRRCTASRFPGARSSPPWAQRRSRRPNRSGTSGTGAIRNRTSPSL